MLSFCSLAALVIIPLLALAPAASAITPAQAYTALDSPAGVEVVGMEYWKYTLVKENWDGDIFYWFAEDDNGDYIYAVSSGASKWAVLSKTADTTTPAAGGSCLYTTDDNDGTAARLALKVRGPGTLTFLYKTSCDYSDAFNVYVDGDPAWSDSGYGFDYTWVETEIAIEGGLAPGGLFTGTFFHEIVFEYFKSEPYYDGSAKIPDGPLRDDFETLAEYNEAKKYFHDRIWLDHVVWTPDPLEIRLSPNPNPINDEEPPAEAARRGVFIDTLTVNVLSNKDEFGYHLRYTTDGTTPTASSPLYSDETGIVLTGTGTVKAKMFDSIATGAPVAVSPEVLVTGAFQAKAAAPALAVDLNASTPDTVLCQATTTTADAVILYTFLPDAIPDQPWPENGLAVTQPGTLRAMTSRPDGGTLDSDIATLTISRAEPPVLTAVVDGTPLPPQARAYAGNTVIITVDSPTGSALYATSSDPGAVWNDYTAPLQFNQEPVTVLARATLAGSLASAPVALNLLPADQNFTFGGIGGAITLHQGWNLLGMPLSPTPEAMDILLAVWPEVFAVDPETDTLIRPDWLAQGQGFWLYCDETTPSALAIGGAVAPATSAATAGWRLLTPAADETNPVTAWRWSPEAGAYVEQVLSPGAGGWKYTP